MEKKFWVVLNYLLCAFSIFVLGYFLVAFVSELLGKPLFGSFGSFTFGNLASFLVDLLYTITPLLAWMVYRQFGVFNYGFKVLSIISLFAISGWGVYSLFYHYWFAVLIHPMVLLLYFGGGWFYLSLYPFLKDYPWLKGLYFLVIIFGLIAMSYGLYFVVEDMIRTIRYRLMN